MNKLQQFFEVEKIKPTPWAVEHKIAPSVISRYLNGKGISPKNAQKIEIATGGRVTVLDLLSRQMKTEAA